MMENTGDKYCVYCGKEISADAKRCIHCGEWLDDNSISTNHSSYSTAPQESIAEENDVSGYVPNNRVEENMDNSSNNYNNANNVNIQRVTEYSKILPIRRLFLLMVFTLGLYEYYWIYKTNCYIRDVLGKDVSPGWRTVGMFVPIASIIVLYMTFDDMNQFIKQERIETYSSGLNVFLLMISGFIPLVGIAIPFWIFINVQETINEFWRIKEPNLQIRRDFSNSEILVMVLGVIFWVIVFIFYIALIAVAMTYPYY